MRQTTIEEPKTIKKTTTNINLFEKSVKLLGKKSILHILPFKKKIQRV